MYPSPHLVSVCVYTWEMLKICFLSKIQAYCEVLLMIIFKVYARRTHLPYIIGGHKRNLHALWPTSPLHVTLCFPEGLHQIQWDLEILGIWVTQKRWWQEGAGGTRKRALREDGAGSDISMQVLCCMWMSLYKDPWDISRWPGKAIVYKIWNVHQWING